MTLSKAYRAKSHENTIYKEWEDSGLFAPTIKKGRRPFTIMMPPPNATGTLHLGHAVMLALEDIMTRYHRMKGDATLWLPGTDHASIATQNKVEKILAEKGKTRHSLGRKEFLKQVEAFVAHSQKTIRKQVRKMGSSCDWSREAYTLSPELSQAVREVFVRMYNDGLIYRGNRIVNWCPRCSSTLADDEVNYKEETAKFYYFRYGPLVIGTARPETKFLDKIIVVHPKDSRYAKDIGREFEVPWINGTVKARILTDSGVDMEFGTGAMTITPAHDFKDFEIAKRHGLEIVSIIDEKGNLTEHAGEFAGRNARQARADIVKKLQEQGLVEKIDEKYVHNISLCYRCDTPVEPLVSRQWFIAVDKPFGKRKKSLKKISLEVVRKGEIKILPERFEKTYFHWMENLHDWCISRQIWFGHRIPVWYCIGGETKGAIKQGSACKPECKNPIVQTEPPKKCPHCGSKNLTQDPDTLDTWFSSGLWTFSTLGWPQKNKDLDFFHPTSVLETGYDILFFWVARMIIMAEYSLGEIPFKTVYLHGLVRTREGKKMSKSDPATCIDPLDMIAKYGADALRLSMVIGATPGNDIRLYEEKIAGFRNFINKIWNAARFAFLSIEAEKKRDGRSASANRNTKKLPHAKSLADAWILTRTQQIIREVTEDIEQFRFSDAGTKIYDFTWGEYCAWYLEISKGEEKNLEVLTSVLETIIKLLHPFVPFVTETLWKHLQDARGGAKTLLLSEEWPKAEKRLTFTRETASMGAVIETITAIRGLRQENGIAASKKLHIAVASVKWKKVLEEKREVITRLVRIEKLDIFGKNPGIHPALTAVTRSGVEIAIHVEGVIDTETERKRIEDELEKLAQYRSTLENKLANKNFVERAPQAIVEGEKLKLNEVLEKISKLQAQLKNM